MQPLKIDDHAFVELITESQDLQSDAMHQARSRSLHERLRDLRESRRGQRPDPVRVARVNESRRALLRKGAIGAGGVAATGLFAGGFGSALAAVVAKPASAQSDLDVDILNTASSLENLAIATYVAALELPFIGGAEANPVVMQFAETTMMQHEEHGQAFNAQATSLGGEEQTEPNAMFAPVVEEATPGLTDPLAVAMLAAQLEEVATETYQTNLTMLEDTESKEIMASVMGVEGQHLGILRAVVALLEGGAADLIALPPDLAALPAAAGSASFPDPMNQINPDLVAPPDSGAVG